MRQFSKKKQGFDNRLFLSEIQSTIKSAEKFPHLFLLQNYYSMIPVVLTICIIQVVFSLQCAQGFLSKGPLGPCIVKGCQKHTADQLCEINGCRIGFSYASPGYCMAQKCREGQAFECQSCVQGYEALTIQSIDLKFCYPFNCAQISSDSIICKKCQSGYLLMQNGGCYLQNCVNFSIDNICTSCKKNYRLENNKCIPNICEKFNKVSNLCQQCSSGYYPVKGNKYCVKKQELCTDYNNITKLCRSCVSGYKLIGLTACIQQMEHCQRYGLKGCQICSNQYEVRNNVCVIRNCKKSNPQKSNECIQCNDGYQIDEKKQCRIVNCAVYNKDVDACFGCKDRFTLDFINGTCITKNCSFFQQSKKNRCALCESQYQLINGQCYLINCKNPRLDKCDQCIEGWLKNQNGNCIYRDCLTYNQSECASCHPGKILYKGSCIQDKKCLLRLPNQQCLQCEQQFYVPFQFKTLCVPFYCAQFDKEIGQCLSCFPDFSLNQKGLCISKYCQKTEQIIGFVYPQCTVCSSGYRPEDRYCVPQRCTKYNITNGTCDQCIEKYELQNLPGSAQNPMVCVNYNCIYFQGISTTKCLACKSGYQYYSPENECFVMNCSKFGEKPKTLQKYCQTCKPDFDPLFGICLAKHCQSYLASGLCQSCYQGYYLGPLLTCEKILCIKRNGDSCIQCEKGYYVSANGSCQPYHCNEIEQQITQNNIKIPVCRKCADGYTQKGRYCVQINCETFSDKFECKTCRKGYSLSNGSCVFFRSFDLCYKGLYFNQKTYNCEPVQVPFCEYVSEQNIQECIKCQDGYLLLQGSCYKINNCLRQDYYLGCIECIFGYKITKPGICENSVPNCQNYQGNQKCANCFKGYQLVTIPKLRCQKIPESCSYLNQQGKCANCRDYQQIIVNNTCIYPSEKCLRFHNIFGQCLQCQKGYYYNANSKNCQKNPVACIQANSKGQCVNCEKLNFIYSGKCYPQIANCAVTRKNLCQTCQPGYYRNLQSKCSQLPIYCEEAEQTGTCKVCKENYYPLLGGCGRKIEFCQKYNQQKRGCIQCSPGYAPSQNKLFCLFGKLIN